jgi:NitT/TauT family transport system substrate-binding protein
MQPDTAQLNGGTPSTIPSFPKKGSGGIFIFVVFSLILSVIMLATAGVILLMPAKKTALTTQDQNKQTSLYSGKIKMGVGLWPGNIGFYVAQEKGFFKDLGLDVDIKVYESLAEESKDYQSGEIVGRGNLTLDAIQEAQQGIDHKVILAVDYSNGADGIVASSSIKTFKDIKGKKVALELGTLEEFFFQFALEQNGMTLADVTPVDLDPEKSVDAFVAGDVDVAVTYEPYLTNALAKGNLIYSSKDAPGLIVDNLTFKTDFIESYPETIDLILKGYFKAMHFAEQNPDEAHEIVAKATKDTKENVADQLKKLTLLDERDNKTAFTFSAGIQSIYTNMRKSAEFVEKESDTDQKIDTDKLVEPRFIKQLEE